MNRRTLATAFLAVTVALPSCGSAPPGASREVRFGGSHPEGRAVTQTELQQDLQRFAGDLIAHISDAGQPLARKTSPEVREAAMRLLLAYDASALDIATGPTPEINLLDMAVFVHLSRSVFERHWAGVFGEESRAIAEAWTYADERIKAVEARVMSEEQQARLHKLADDWLGANPNLVRVEGIRFTEFAQIAGKLSKEQAEEAGGSSPA